MLVWGHVFIWIAIGAIVLLAGVVISSLRRKHRSQLLAHIPRRAMTVFKTNIVSKQARETIEHSIRRSFEIRDACQIGVSESAKAWGWSLPGKEFEAFDSVNYTQVVVNSPFLIEHAANMYFAGSLIRTSNQNFVDYFNKVVSKAKLDNAHCDSYLELVLKTSYDPTIQVTFRQYKKWIPHLLYILDTLNKAIESKVKHKKSPSGKKAKSR